MNVAVAVIAAIAAVVVLSAIVVMLASVAVMVTVVRFWQAETARACARAKAEGIRIGVRLTMTRYQRAGIRRQSYEEELAEVEALYAAWAAQRSGARPAITRW
jgi:hypothetical protein